MNLFAFEMRITISMRLWIPNMLVERVLCSTNADVHLDSSADFGLAYGRTSSLSSIQTGF